MRLAALLMLTCSLAVADDKAVRKVVPPADKLAAAAGEAFTKAKEADEAGKLDEAERLYRKAFAIAPHPFCQYNLADVLRRKNNISSAITAYKKYLEMDPAAADRKQVEKIVTDLEAMPGTIIIEVEESDALVFVDGQPLQRNKDPKNPFVIQMPAGPHTVDVITAISYDNDTCYAYHNSKRNCRMRLRPRVDGNVVISGPKSMSRASRGHSGRPTIHTKGRFTLDPGKQPVFVAPSDNMQCKPVEIDVAKGDTVVTYVWVETPDTWPQYSGGKRPCVDLPYKQRVLRF